AGDLVVDFRVKRIVELVSYVVLLKVGLSDSRREIRRGNLGQDRRGDRADAVGRRPRTAGRVVALVDVVVRESQSAGSIQIARQRVVDFRRGRAEVAGAKRHRRNRGALRAAGVINSVLIIPEEKELVLFKRTAERKTGLQILARRTGVRKVTE